MENKIKTATYHEISVLLGIGETNFAVSVTFSPSVANIHCGSSVLNLGIPSLIFFNGEESQMYSEIKKFLITYNSLMNAAPSKLLTVPSVILLIFTNFIIILQLLHF